MCARFQTKYQNWLASDRKLRKAFVSLRYHLFAKRSWDRIMTLDTKGRFTGIYKYNLWNNEESRSGLGSTIRQTARVRNGLQAFLEARRIRSVCDAGCGDFNWMKEVGLSRVRYVGVDIVKELVAENRKRYASRNLSFLELDVINDDLPSVDLILCRDVLIHLSFQDLCSALRNFKKTGSKFLLTTHCPSISENADARTGKCHLINLQSAPLCLSAPLMNIEEDMGDRCLALWKLEDIEPARFRKE